MLCRQLSRLQRGRFSDRPSCRACAWSRPGRRAAAGPHAGPPPTQQQGAQARALDGAECSPSPSASSAPQPQAALAVAAAAAALLCALPAGAAQAGDAQHIHHLAAAQFDLAEDTDFWANVARYGRYFVTVMLGTGYVMVKPLMNAFKNPVSATLAVAAVVALAVGIKVTLELMLGLTATDYPIEN